MFFRRRSSVEQREKEWLAQSERERVAWEQNNQSKQLDFREHPPAAVHHTQAQVSHPEGPLHAHKVKKKPPPPPSRQPIADYTNIAQSQVPPPPPLLRPRGSGDAPAPSATQSRQPTGTVIEVGQREQSSKPPPPPPRRQAVSNVVEASESESPLHPPTSPRPHTTNVLVDAPQNESKRRPPPPRPRQPRSALADTPQHESKPHPSPSTHRQPTRVPVDAQQNDSRPHPPPSPHRQPASVIGDVRQNEAKPHSPPPPRCQPTSVIVDAHQNETKPHPPPPPSRQPTSVIGDVRQNEAKPHPPPSPRRQPTSVIVNAHQNETKPHPPPPPSRQPTNVVVDVQKSDSKPHSPQPLRQPTTSGFIIAQDRKPPRQPPPPPTRSETRGSDSPSGSTAIEPEKEGDKAVARWRHRRPSGVRVAALVESWESMASRAEAEAARNASMLREADRTKVRAYFEQRRAEARALEERSIVAVPQFANVARDPTEIVVEISAPGHSVQWCIAPSGVEKIESSMSWMTKRAPVRVRLNPGRFVVLARSVSDEGDFSEVTSAVFWFSPPPSIEHQLHPRHALRWIDQDDSPTTTARNTTLRLICANCGKDLEKKQAARLEFERRACATAQARGRYACLECERFELCLPCAFAAVSSTSISSTSRPKPPSHVALDSGGRRIWLSEPIAFEGNLTIIKPESYAMLALLAGTLRRNPGLCIRLEGHSNSNCGLACDGTAPCSNNTCRALFGDGKGGAVGFTKARASAVRKWLLTEGGLELEARERIAAVGLGGSRNLVDDTEGPENYLNRRVEAHIVDFICTTDYESSIGRIE